MVRWIAVMASVLAASASARLAAQDTANQRGEDVRPASKETLVYVGTYTGGASKGIYLFRLQTRNLEVSQNSTLVPLGLAAETPSPSFLAIDRSRRLVFAVNEVDELAGTPGGGVSAFSVDDRSGKLTLINQRPSGGAGPCHIVLDRAGRHVLVANYGGGSVAAFPVAENGDLGEATALVQHKGSSVNPQRQEGPHAHCVTLDPAGKFVFVCDLGLDKVMIYQYDDQRGTLEPHDPPFAKLAPGAGPRHMAFRPDGRFAYVINELNSTVTTFSYNADAGVLGEIQSVSTLPASFDGDSTTAEIDVHPSGKFLYGSNRGHDSVVLFTINETNGTLSWVEDQTSGGRTPRHFGIQPSGEHMVIANQATDTLLACRIDAANGRLKSSGVFAEAPTPVCAVFLPPRE
jgi:6-phosphogluconolactonase